MADDFGIPEWPELYQREHELTQRLKKENNELRSMNAQLESRINVLLESQGMAAQFKKVRRFDVVKRNKVIGHVEARSPSEAIDAALREGHKGGFQVIPSRARPVTSSTGKDGG